MKAIAFVSILMLVFIARRGDAQDVLHNYDRLPTNFGHQQQVTRHGSGLSSGPASLGDDRHSPGSTTNFAVTSMIHEGGLTLAAHDAAKSELAWRGVPTKPMDLNALIDKQKKNLEQALSKLLETKMLETPKGSLGPWKNGWWVSGARFSYGSAGLRFRISFKH